MSPWIAVVLVVLDHYNELFVDEDVHLPMAMRIYLLASRLFDDVLYA